MIDFLKAHMELFIIVGLLLLSGLLKVAFIRRIKKKEVKDLLESIVNWISIFLVIGLLFVYFSDTKWLFGTLTTINNSSISLFMIIFNNKCSIVFKLICGRKGL
jgi:hypothetical protein